MNISLKGLKENHLKIIIKAESKELATFMLLLQKQPESEQIRISDVKEASDKLMQSYERKISQRNPSLIL